MASSEFSGTEKCMLATLLSIGNAVNACIGYDVGPKYANRHISIMEELTALLNSTNKNVAVVVKATEQQFCEKLYTKGEVDVILSVEVSAIMYKFHIYDIQKKVGTLPMNTFTQQQRKNLVKMIIAGQAVTAKASWLSSSAFLLSIDPDEQPMPDDTLFVAFGL